MKIEDSIIPQIVLLKYVEYVVQNNGKTKRNINHQDQTGWLKWMRA